LTRFDVRVSGESIEIDLDAPIGQADTAGVARALVRYGAAGHVGRFGSIESIACQRGDRVLVATDRGVEAGEVLVGPGDTAADSRPPAGELLRLLSAEDEQAVDDRRASALRVVELIQARLAHVAPQVVILDGEYTFDGGTLILYHLGVAHESLGRLAAELAEVAQARVQFETIAADASRTIAAAGRTSEIDPITMRGPYERLKYDFRRVWECPVCHHRERTAGSVTSQFCPCQAKEEPHKQVPMKLVDDGPRRTDGRTLPPRKPTLP
jgi:hypothetical protein